MKNLLVWLGVAVMAGCGANSVEEGRREPASRPAPVQVSVAPVRKAAWGDVRTVVGTVRARVAAQVSARLLAYVQEVRVDTGDTVRAGQVLVVLDAKELDAAVRRAEEAVAEAQNARAEMDSAIEAAKARLELAQITFRRMSDLHEKKSVSSQEFDEAKARLRMEESSLEAANSRRKQLDSRIAQAAEALRAARIQRGYAQITAPFAGVVTEKHAEPGNMATPGAPLLTIEQTGALRLEAPVDESLLPLLRRGQRVEVELDALGKIVTATVSEIVPAIDPASRSATVKLDLPPMDGLRSGMSGRARIGAGETEVLIVPAEAVRPQGSLNQAFVAEDGVARARLITLGERRGDGIELLSGLQEGDRIIHPLPPLLADGTPVEVRP